MDNRKAHLPQRYRRFGVGKEIGGAIHLHRQYEELLGLPVAIAKSLLPINFEYTVVKHNWVTASTSFTFSPDFDTMPEPTLGASVIVRADGTVRVRPPLSDPYIYHHKWLLVRDDYTGFNIDESIARSLAWAALKKIDRSRIGRKGYWEATVLAALKSRCE